MDESVLGNDVHNINCLTVIASESYEKFAKELQTEFTESIGDRPVKVTAELFRGRELVVDCFCGPCDHYTVRYGLKAF